MFESYSEALAWFDRAQNKGAGRRVHHRMRMFQDGDKLRMEHDRVPFCIFNPDNTITYVMPVDRLMNRSSSLTQLAHGVAPIGLVRKRTGVYRLWTGARRNSRYYDRFQAPKYNYYEGVSFDLATLTCLNPKADPASRVIPEMRRVWLAHLREFKKQVQLRRKLGVLEAIIPTAPNHVPRNVAYETLLAALRSKTVTTAQLAILVGFVISTSLWFSTPTAAQAAEHIHALCTSTFSMKLRQDFGVFEED